ncbi:hypothetical protein [Flammeovirga kamogawensis]|uniref:Uncharacterized protein n=1 Tax=Flammeovirga kamogawensis TaxID=373891 RepID=A0ABX8H365_9BACT|nr:hypothetical protein [Flammeovirga kamogawensis]MBB6460455.1 hypothetical protein [Flammeovirga kamogawensis]QWG10260.1 hypothetical protein KM029_21495 [Flammeovirga kamogawensis]TRX64709.1 hypothetical protein EO216_19420 [Flammeovirga kamogawensis]
MKTIEDIEHLLNNSKFKRDIIHDFTIYTQDIVNKDYFLRVYKTRYKIYKQEKDSDIKIIHSLEELISNLEPLNSKEIIVIILNKDNKGSILCVDINFSKVIGFLVNIMKFNYSSMV